MGDITRADIAKSLANFSKISLQEADWYVDFILNTIADCIAEGKSIELRGFGSFGSKMVKARKRVSPPKLLAGDKNRNKLIPAHKKVFFRPGAALKNAVRNGTEIARPLRKNSLLRLSEWRKEEIAERWEKMKGWGYVGFPDIVPDTHSELVIAEKEIHFARDIKKFSWNDVVEAGNKKRDERLARKEKNSEIKLGEKINE